MIFSLLPLNGKKHGFNNNFGNVIEDKNLIFLHNPKCAGQSIAKLIGLKKICSHLHPSDICSKEIWEQYYSFVVIRNPFDRLISFFKYHTSEKYNGAFIKKYKNLKYLSFEDYFRLMSKKEYIIGPQVKYLTHKDSIKVVDAIIHFDKLESGLKRVLSKHNVDVSLLPHKNKSLKDDNEKYFSNTNFINEVNEYYSSDINFFNFSPLTIK